MFILLPRGLRPGCAQVASRLRPGCVQVARFGSAIPGQRHLKWQEAHLKAGIAPPQFWKRASPMDSGTIRLESRFWLRIRGGGDSCNYEHDIIKASNIFLLTSTITLSRLGFHT